MSIYSSIFKQLQRIRNGTVKKKQNLMSKPDFYQIKEHAIEFSKKQSTLKCENKFNEIEFPKFFVFHKYSSHLYQYTPFTSSIDMGSVNKENSLFKRIDGSKSSVFKPKP